MDKDIKEELEELKEKLTAYDKEDYVVTTLGEDEKIDIDNEKWYIEAEEKQSKK